MAEDDGEEEDGVGLVDAAGRGGSLMESERSSAGGAAAAATINAVVRQPKALERTIDKDASAPP